MSSKKIQEIKEQIISQIDSWKASSEQKEQAKEQIQAMSDEELGEFLEKNNMIKSSQDCVFCLIIQGKIPSYKLAEDKENIAVLEINPQSKAHSIIIPKKHAKNISELPQSSLTLAKEIAERIRQVASPKDISISPANLFGHEIISIIPDYEIKQEKRKASEEELKELQKILTSPIKKQEEEKKIGKKAEEKPKKLEKAPRRIP